MSTYVVVEGQGEQGAVALPVPTSIVLPWFGSLENALKFLESAGAGHVYPPEAKGS